MTMKVRSLFSGVGGLDLGLERAGMEVISQCELEDFRRDILRRHWADTEISDDVQSVHYEAGSADILVGGFPCQDLSVAGRRKGLDGSRSGLFFEFARVADECVPEGGWILIENVPGLLSSKDGRDFGVLLSTLVDLGFHDIAWRVLDSRYFGVPQRRRRVFILARRAHGQRAAEVLLEPEGDGGHPQEGRKKASRRPRAAAQGAAAGGGAALDEAGEGAPQHLANALDKMAGGADDNDAQGNHIVPVGLGKDPSVSGTLGKKGVGGGGLGLDREGAFVLDAADIARAAHRADAVGVLGSASHTLTSEGMDASEDGTGRGTPVVTAEGFNWQSGGDVRLQVKNGESPTLQTQQVPAVHVVIAPEVAAPLTRGHAAGKGVSVPGRRMEDDKNIIAFQAWNMQDLEGVAGTLLGGTKKTTYSLNNMPLVAKCLTAHERWDLDTEDFVVHAADEYPTLRSNERNNSNPTTQADMHPVVRPRAVGGGKTIWENQQSAVWETDYANPVTKAGGKPGQGYVAARVMSCSEATGLVRRLTPTECERLQGFPDGWTLTEGGSLAGESSWYEVGVVATEDGHKVVVPRASDPDYLDRMLASLMGGYEVEEPAPDGRRYAAMGDAVTVPVAHWIGARLLAFGAG